MVSYRQVFGRRGFFVRKFILLLAGLILVAGCASQATYGDPIIEGEPTPIPTPIIPTKPEYNVQRGDIVYRREFIGRVAPVNNQELVFRRAGQVQEVFFDVGDTVQQGDVIAVLNSSLLEAQRLQAQADLDVTRSLLEDVQSQQGFDRQRAQLNLGLAQLRVDYARSKAGEEPTADELFQIRSLEIERDLAQLGVDELDQDIDPELQLAVNRAEQTLEEIGIQIEDTRMVAPIDGRIMVLRLSPGDQVEGFMRVGAVADVSTLEVQDQLLTSDMMELAEGMPAEMHPANAPGESMPGVLVSLPPPYGTGADEVVHVQFSQAEQSASLEIGDRIRVSILVDQRDDVLWLPVSAIRKFAGRDFVVIKTEGIQQRVDVRLGLTGDDRVEILEGLEVGQTVIAA
jgi:multidrug efflux pump subunit AcrA (membrane-fusion protein)